MSNKVKMIVRRIPKKTVQNILRDIRQSVWNLNIEKDSFGYKVTTKNGTLVFQAMNGTRDYLTRWHPKLLAAFNG
tara:strand:+ start:693 stop:917 length:225 start_codon:yes stop_codon:yes gene_type:complete